MHIRCIYTHIMLYIYTVFIYTFTYYTLSFRLLLVIVTDALHCPLEENWSKGKDLLFMLSVFSNSYQFFYWAILLRGSYFCCCVIAGWKNVTWKIIKSQRVTFSQVGRLPVESGELWGELRGFWLTRCALSGPAQQMSWDVQGGVAGNKLAGSDWVQQGRGLFNSRSGGNCPRSRWPQPCHLLSLPSSSLCCHGLLAHLQVTGEKIKESWVDLNQK